MVNIETLPETKTQENGQFSILCSCGIASRSLVTIDSHIRETGHSLESGQATLLDQRLQANGRALEAARLRLAFLESDDKMIRNILSISRAEAMRAAPVKPRPCMVCRKPTTDRFGAVAKCKHHVHNDKAVVDILDTLLNT